MNKFVKSFKYLFIPHIHNDYKPHFFREISTISIAVVIIVLFSISLGSNLYIKNTNMTATVLPAVLVDLTNDVRISNNEQSLTRNTVLDDAARLKAEDMASLGYFAHNSPTGITPWNWFNKAGYVFVYAGENLAIDFSESVDVENAWLNSPTHKANILNNHFTEIGIATAEGVYQGHPTTYVVQMFGKPAIKSTEEIQSNLLTPIKKEVNIIDKKLPSLNTDIIPTVKGESVGLDQNLKIITETKEFVAVKNIDAKEKEEPTVPSNQYSTWYQKFLFMAPSYIDCIYRIFIFIVLIALLLMVVIEFKLQHKKNIIYGVLLLVLLLSLVYLNRELFLSSFFS